MSVRHSLATDPEIHEPKGVSTASSGEVYKANGTGSGAWSKPGGAIYGFMHTHSNTTAVYSGSGIVALDTYYIIDNSWSLAHGDDVTINGTNDGLIAPVGGDYYCNINMSGYADSGGVDKVILTTDILVNGVAEGHTSKIYLDKTKPQNWITQGVLVLSASDVVTVRVQVITGDVDAGGVPIPFTVTDATMMINLLHTV